MSNETALTLSEASRKIDLRQDMRKLVRIIAAHNGAFTKLDPKIILTLGRPIINKVHPFQAEDFLSTLNIYRKLYIAMMLKLNCLLWRETKKLAAKFEINLLLDEKVSAAIACCETFLANFKKIAFLNSISTSKLRLPKIQ